MCDWIQKTLSRVFSKREQPACSDDSTSSFSDQDEQLGETGT